MTMKRSDIEKLLKNAEAGDIEKQYQVGKLYEEGSILIKEPTFALKWYKMAADGGHVLAKCQLALYSYQAGDYQAAFEWYLKASQQGSRAATFNLGKMYEEGRFVPKDRIKAIIWYKETAQYGYNEALERLKELAGQGSLYAQQALKELNDLEELRAKEELRAQEELKIKKDKKLLNGKEGQQSSVKIMGQIHPADYKETKESEETQQDKCLTTESSISNQEVTTNDLFQRLAELSGGTFVRSPSVITDILKKLGETKIEQLLLAAEKGDAHAQYAAGVLYEKGAGVIRDSELAIRWYEDAARQDHIPAQSQLAFLLNYMGEHDEAYKWYLSAFRLGSKTAMFKIGMMYEEGNDFLQKDTNMAISWYANAARRGNLEAQQRLEEMAGEIAPRLQTIIDLKITTETEQAFVLQMAKEKQQIMEEGKQLAEVLTELKYRKEKEQKLKEQSLVRQELKKSLKTKNHQLKNVSLEKDRLLNEMKTLEDERRALEQALREKERLILEKRKLFEAQEEIVRKAANEKEQAVEQLKTFEHETGEPSSFHTSVLFSSIKQLTTKKAIPVKEEKEEVKKSAEESESVSNALRAASALELGASQMSLSSSVGAGVVAGAGTGIGISTPVQVDQTLEIVDTLKLYEAPKVGSKT